MRAHWTVTIVGAALLAETVDRIAVTVDNSVITLSEIQLQERTAAFLDSRAVRNDPDTLRQAAERLIDQTLIRREIAAAAYPAAPPDTARKMLAQIRKERFQDDAARYQKALSAARLREEDLLAQLAWQADLLRFVEARFRPGVQVPEEDIQAEYEETFVREWKAVNSTPPPPLADVHERLEAKLIEQRTDQALDRWLNQSRTQTRVIFREGVFEGKS